MYAKLEKWVPQTINFEAAASKVFQRLIRGNGPGLLMLQGGYPTGKKANKSLFLGMVQEFEEGAESEESFLSDKFPDLSGLLEEIDSHEYQCFDVKQIWKRFTSNDNEDKIFQIPLSVVVTYALAFEGKAHGFTTYRPVVILCDDIEKFMRYNKESRRQRPCSPVLHRPHRP